jgi:hypothetical protein
MSEAEKPEIIRPFQLAGLPGLTRPRLASELMLALINLWKQGG